MPLLYYACWNTGADQVPRLAGLGKKPRKKLARASTWADAGNRDSEEEGRGIPMSLSHLRPAARPGKGRQVCGGKESRSHGPWGSGVGKLPHQVGMGEGGGKVRD